MASPAEDEKSTCSSDDVLSVSFNQDYSSLCIGTKSGFTICNTSSVNIGFKTIYDNEGETKDIYIIERLYLSGLLAIVSMTTPATLRLYYFKTKREICTESYPSPIIAVRLSRRRLVVVLENRFFIHDIKDMKTLHTICDTPPNPKGVCAMNTNNDNDTSFLAYPGSPANGEVQIFDLVNLKATVSISAHNGALATLAFNPPGTKLATASDKGTVIRVFSIPKGQLLFELRRGLKRYADISCLAFNEDSDFLCVSSNTETVHIFRLPDTTGMVKEDDVPVADDSGSWMGYFNSVVSGVSASVSYLPTQVSSVLSQGRAFATAKLPNAGIKNICAMVTMQKVQYIIVVGYNLCVYVYAMDVTDGGECALSRQHHLRSQIKTSENDSFDVPVLEHKAGSSDNDLPRVLYTHNESDLSDEIPFDGDSG